MCQAKSELIQIMLYRSKDNHMKIGYLFPIAVIVGAIVLFAWFIIGGYAMPEK